MVSWSSWDGKMMTQREVFQFGKITNGLLFSLAGESLYIDEFPGRRVFQFGKLLSPN